MLNHSVEVFKEITDYLTKQNIPCCANDPSGIVTFFASTTDMTKRYHYRVNISEDFFWMQATAPIEIPQTDKIQVPLLNFCNYVNHVELSGGFLVLDRDAGKLRCHMVVPFADNHCGRVDRILPVPANMLDYYGGAIQRLITGANSVEREVKSWKRIYQHRNITPLVSSPLFPESNYRFSTRRGFVDQKILEEAVLRIFGSEDRET